MHRNRLRQQRTPRPASESAPLKARPDDDWASRYIRRMPPIVNADTERELAVQARAGDPVARRKLIQANLRLVVHFARRYVGKGLEFMDLIQEGNLGLVKAVDRFDPAVGVRFSTYAAWWIHQAMAQLHGSHDRPFRLPGHMLDKLRRWRRAREQWFEAHGDWPSDTWLAGQLGWSVSQVQTVAQLDQKPAALDTPTHDDTPSPGEELPDERWTPEALWTRRYRAPLVWLALQKTCSAQEQRVIVRRYGLQCSGNSPSDEGWTLAQVGRAEGISRECARQIALRAVAKLKRSPLLQHLMDD